MAETRVSHIPCRQRANSHAGERQKPQTEQDIELPAEEIGQFQPVFRNPLVTQRV